MANVQKNLWISEDIVSYIKKVEKENNLSSEGKALEKICNEHAGKKNDLISEIANTVVDKIKNDLTRIRLGTNTADRNSKIILEMLNHIFIAEDYKKIITTDKFKSYGLAAAEESVKKQLDNLRQRRLEKDESIKGE